MSSLNIAASALTTNMSVLQTIGNNIANANTVGYSRQSVQLSPVQGQTAGSGYFGKGVEIASVTRSYNAFLTKQANSTQTVASADAMRLQQMQQVESLFPLGDGSLGTQLNTALNAWTDVQSSPSDATARGVVIDQSSALASRITDTSTRLQELGDTARLQSESIVKSINDTASQIAKLNGQISQLSASGAVPNDLLDQRDKLISDLGKQVQVSTIDAGNGTTTVFVGGSMPLVLGTQAASLRVDRSTLDPSHRQTISFMLGNQASTIPDSQLGGGSLKGLQDFINTDLTQTQAQLGRMALALGTVINQQQNSGLDLSGNAGANLFTLPTPTAYAATGNAGTTQLAMSVSDATALQPSDYEVTYNTSTTVTITRLSDNQVVTGASPVTIPAAGLVFDGLTLTQPAGGAVAGDRFLLRPAADAGASIGVGLSAPGNLAVASRLSVAPNTTNTGATTIQAASNTLLQGSFPSSPATIPSFTLTYNSAASDFSVPAPAAPATVSPATISYTPGQPMQFTYDDGLGNQYSYNLTLSGQPANGDTFALSQTTSAAVKFNAGNAQAMLALRDQVTFDGNATLADGYVPVFSDVATRLQSVQFSANFSQSQAASAETQRSNVSGVNLDEEAANLIQYQQAYQASARFLQTAQSLFSTLLQSFG
jgi:flagellar hook-associated protein 1 FlgK